MADTSQSTSHVAAEDLTQQNEGPSEQERLTDTSDDTILVADTSQSTSHVAAADLAQQNGGPSEQECLTDTSDDVELAADTSQSTSHAATEQGVFQEPEKVVASEHARHMQQAGAAELAGQSIGPSAAESADPNRRDPSIARQQAAQSSESDLRPLDPEHEGGFEAGYQAALAASAVGSTNAAGKYASQTDGDSLNDPAFGEAAFEGFGKPSHDLTQAASAQPMTDCPSDKKKAAAKHVSSQQNEPLEAPPEATSDAFSQQGKRSEASAAAAPNAPSQSRQPLEAAAEAIPAPASGRRFMVRTPQGGTLLSQKMARSLETQGLPKDEMTKAQRKKGKGSARGHAVMSMPRPAQVRPLMRSNPGIVRSI